MAQILLGGAVADIRGSIGGITYSRNRSGAYARNKTTPINAGSDKQSAVRANFASVAALFQTLKSSEAEAWTQYAALVPQFNSFGQEYIPSGKQMFMVANLNRSLVGQAQSKAPAFSNTTLPSLDLNSLVMTTEVTGGVLVELSYAGLATNDAANFVIVQATPPMQAVRESYRNRMRELSNAVFNAANDLTNAQANYFNGGDPLPATVDQIVNLRARAVNADSGLSSAWYYFKATLTA